MSTYSSETIFLTSFCGSGSRVWPINVPVVTSGALGGILRLVDADADTGTRTSGGGPLGGKTIPSFQT